MTDTTALDTMKRAELEAHATTVGVDDPKSFRSVDELKAAILAAGSADTGRTNAGVNSPNQDSGVVQTNVTQDVDTVDAEPKQRIGVYIVNGIEVDPNGKPLDNT